MNRSMRLEVFANSQRPLEMWEGWKEICGRLVQTVTPLAVRVDVADIEPGIVANCPGSGTRPRLHLRLVIKVRRLEAISDCIEEWAARHPQVHAVKWGTTAFTPR